MRKLHINILFLGLAASVFSACDNRISETDEKYLQVIGEYEQTTPDGGYRLVLSYNGPVSTRNNFQYWADSLQKVMPEMVKTNDNIYINYMPEQMGKTISDNMYQVGVSYNLIVKDSATYNSISKDLLTRQIPFSLNMTGSFIGPEKKEAMQQEMMQKAIANAKAKLDFLKGDSAKTYEIIAIEELDSNQPFGPEYYDYNRRMVVRIKVKARLN